jgi:FAD binding domain/PASTA domain
MSEVVMTQTFPPVSVRISQPRQGEELPVGTDVLTRGSAAGVGGAEPHPIDTVTVRLNDSAPVDATVTRSSPPSPVVTWAATVTLAEPGEQRITVTATNDIGRTASATVVLVTPGTTSCRQGILWQNYPRTRSITPASTCAPATLSGLVAAVKGAEVTGQRAHASGSRWAFSDCAVTGDTSIDTRALKEPVQTVHRALLPGVTTPVVHVEAGITIEALYHWLDRLGLALETMGGAAGQTLVGAVSTGTHGGDKALPPIADSVLALHLVGVGGTQYWVEPSAGITDPALLRQHVAPGVDPGNVVYDDELFNACLVSLGCLGIVYSVVLRVREQYDLVETTRRMSWREFQAGFTAFLDDPANRFLQVLVSPYRRDGEHPCLVTVRAEAAATSPLMRSTDLFHTILHIALDIGIGPDLLAVLGQLPSIDFHADQDELITQIAEIVLTRLPDQLPILERRYIDILGSRWPEGPLRGLSHSVMDLGYGTPPRASQPGNSLEMFFPTTDGGGRLGCARFVDETIGTIAAATDTFFAGYISIRFTSATRAFLGMQRWPQTCAVEVSAVRGVRRMAELIQETYRVGLRTGGLPHWGQQLDFGVPGYREGYGGVYPDYARWRRAYHRMSNGFTQTTFATELSDRWNLTRPDDAEQVSITAPAEVVQGRSARFVVTLRNSGASTWAPGPGVVLAPEVSPDTAAWGLAPVPVAQSTPPASNATFVMDVTAPAQLGLYRFAWRLRREPGGAFGARTTTLVVRAVPGGPVTVPDLVDLSGQAADRVVRQAGLVPAFTGSLNPPNHVGSQNPAADAVVPPGTTVSIRLLPGAAP